MENKKVHYEKKTIKCNNIFIDKCKIFDNNENINEENGQQIDDFTKGKKKMRGSKRVGIVGAGMMGKQHIEALRRIPGIEIAALADPDSELVQRTCVRTNIPRFYTDYGEMLQKESLDAVHICTPNYTHYRISRDALEAGVSVFCEKPLGNTSAETNELTKLAAKKQLAAGVNFNYRQNVVVREMHELVNTPDWGRTFLIRGEYIQDWMMYDTDYNWRCIPEMNGPSRTIADVGSHWFDAVQYITGQKVAKVYAKLITVHHQRKKFDCQADTFEKQSGGSYQLMDIDSEDAAFVLFEMTDGTPGILTLSQVSAGYKNGMVISIDGAAGSLTWEQENVDKLLVRTRETGTTIKYAAAGDMHGEANRYTVLPGGHPVGWADGLKNSISAFYEYLNKKEPPRFASFEDGNRIVKIVEACLRSNKTGRWVDVEEA